MVIHKSDNVEVNISDGHKYARNLIKKGEPVIKYGNPIGYATKDIQAGDWVHTHNLVTALSGNVPYTYAPVNIQLPSAPNNLHFMGYKRPDGDVGIRNDIWIIVTVGCVNKIAERIAELTSAYAFTHPYGCSQLGDDHAITQKVLRGLVNHPNCGGVLVLGLGCENNNIDEFKTVLGNYDPNRVKFLNCQDVEDEISEGIKLVNALKEEIPWTE